MSGTRSAFSVRRSRSSEAARLTVRRPGGAVQTFEHLPASRYFRLRQGGEPG